VKAGTLPSSMILCFSEEKAKRSASKAIGETRLLSFTSSYFLFKPESNFGFNSIWQWNVYYGVGMISWLPRKSRTQCNWHLWKFMRLPLDRFHSKVQKIHPLCANWAKYIQGKILGDLLQETSPIFIRTVRGPWMLASPSFKRTSAGHTAIFLEWSTDQ